METGQDIPRPHGGRGLSRAFSMTVCRALLAFFVFGCAHTKDPTLTYFGNSDLEHYEDSATRIENPEGDGCGVEESTATLRPHSIREHATQDEIWDMTLAEAIHLALVNNRIARTRNDFLSPGSAVLNNPEGVVSVYDPAIRETGVLFGTRGVESALAAFDTQFYTNMVWGSSSAIQNNTLIAGGLPEGGVLNEDTANFSTGLTKNMAYGATLGVSHNWNYLLTNQPFQLFPAVYTGNVMLNYTQPLWAGAGAEVNRVAGPITLNVPGVSGVNQGVLVARINTDISLVDFEAQIRNMIKDVEDVYWDLYFAYRNFDSLVTARNSALATWRVVSAKTRMGMPGGGSAAEGEALETYYDARARAEAALGGPAGRGASSAEPGIYGLELQLRRLLRLPANDGRVIRPADEPAVAEILPDWHLCLAEALTRREEIRRQKWNIKSLELQLDAARNLAHPQLNFVSSYQVNGFGRQLFAPQNDGTTRAEELTSAYRLLARADQTGWTMGLQFNMPLGLRNALSQVRNYELRLQKARDVLATQELEVSHELANSFQLLDYWYTTMNTGYNRLAAAEQRLIGVEAEYQADRKELEFLLQAQTRYAAAEAAFYRSVAEYNKSVAEIHYRKGTLLENNSIHLSENTWTRDAYKDALRRAWARTFAIDAPEIDPVEQVPAPFVDPLPISDAPANGVEIIEFSSPVDNQKNPALPGEQPLGVRPMLPRLNPRPPLPPRPQSAAVDLSRGKI